METITVIVGSVNAGKGTMLDDTRQVQFEGEKLATVHQTGTREDQEADKPMGLAAWAIAAKSRAGAQEDQGTDATETLYRASDGRLLVYVQDWTHFKDGPAVYTLHEVAEQDLSRTGRFAQLGQEAGFWRADGARTWGPEGPICQRCGKVLSMSAMPAHHAGGEPIYLCHDCQISGRGAFNR